MGKLFLLYLILQISLLAGSQFELVSNPNNNEQGHTFSYNLQDDKKDNKSWHNKFISYLTNPDRKTRLAITTGLNLCYLRSSTSHHINYNNHDSFRKVIYGPSAGVSIIRKMYNDSNLTIIGGELEFGVFVSKEVSGTLDYIEMKASNGVYYLQFPISGRAVKKLKSGHFASFTYGLCIGKGISKEWKYKEWNTFLGIGYRIKRLETEILCKFVFFDWDSAFAGALTPYTDIAFTQSAIFKFNLKYRI